MGKKKQQVEIICVIDKSGSMQATKNDAIGGFNEFIEKQKKVSEEILFSAIFFNTPPVTRQLEYDGVKITDVKPLTEDTYVPSGGTALFDAIGVAAEIVLERHSKLKNPPKVMMMILTDGEENSSQEYTHKTIKAKIEELQEKNKWAIVYIGATLDRFTNDNMQRLSTSIGISGFSGHDGTSCSGYSGVSGMRVAYSAMAMYSKSFVGDNSNTPKTS